MDSGDRNGARTESDFANADYRSPEKKMDIISPLSMGQINVFSIDPVTNLAIPHTKRSQKKSNILALTNADYRSPEKMDIVSPLSMGQIHMFSSHSVTLGNSPYRTLAKKRP